MKALVITLACLLSLPACTTSYSARPITARVIDAQAKQPVEGVVVVAHWELEGGLEGGYPQGELMVLEAVTDQTGTFHVPGWGPKKIPPGRASNARLKDLDPVLILFKSGYRFRALQNQKSMDEMARKGPALRFSDYDGKTIELEKFDGTLTQYADHLEKLTNEMDPLRADCIYKQIPMMMKAFDRQVRVFRAAGDRRSFFPDWLRSNEDYKTRAGCGSVKQFFQQLGE